MNAPVLFLACMMSSLALATSLRANAIVFTDEDLGMSEESETGRKRSLAELPNCSMAFADFRLSLGGIAVENFENYTALQSLTNIFFGTNKAEITGGVIQRPPAISGHNNGQFAISGDQFLGTTETITIRFSAPQAAFGFFLTDVEVCSRDVILIGSDGTRRTNAVPATLVPRRSSGCIFYGILDREAPFVAVELSGVCNEGYGFDDMMIEQIGQGQIPASLSIDTYAGIKIHGTTNTNYRIEASSTLEFTSWETQKTVRLLVSPFFYVDETPIRRRGRQFYRAIAE